MASSMYELALQLEQELSKISSKKGHVVFRTLKGETKFVFQFEKNHTKGLVIQLLKNEEELAFLSRRIQKLMMRRNQIKKSFPPRSNPSKPETDISQIRCYGCNQLGHFKTDCPKLKQSKANLSSKISQ